MNTMKKLKNRQVAELKDSDLCSRLDLARIFASLYSATTGRNSRIICLDIYRELKEIMVVLWIQLGLILKNIISIHCT
ncbi:hypothetical protein V1478_009614 [Vespula squamosa]|uniref:Uncharacterized protein n=1 Tax=Vespula squamosa TaxID=30214 RepID=A0ABD2AQT2_VESSQ